MPTTLGPMLGWVFGPEPPKERMHLWPRWLWLRALGLIFFSAFYSLVFQIQGLIGPDGILPAGEYLKALAQQAGPKGYWYVPSLLWLGSGPHALKLICWTGLVASILLALNFWPRGTLAACLVTYLSFVSAAQDFSSYQSDGMLLEAGFLSLFFAPPGLLPGLGLDHLPSRASLFLLRWEWFRIYFESGFVKLASHDLEWRSLTALNHYYENGPLPNWIGWYAQQLPHQVHAGVTALTLGIELGLVWMLFLPRRFRQICFWIVTPFQIGIILTANLAFLNYLVLALGILLLDDEYLRDPLRWFYSPTRARLRRAGLSARDAAALPGTPSTAAHEGTAPVGGRRWGRDLSRLIRRWSLAIPVFCLSWIFYNTTALLLLMIFPGLPLPTTPVLALEPFRISGQYGLFAVMTAARYEIEFQGSEDGKTWIAYPFRYKPQDPRQPPRFYAPYQPRFDWNLWFASLGGWQGYPFVVRTEVRLLENSPSVLSLFAGNPFDAQPPRQVRAVIWQYWFTDLSTERRQGLWWSREFRGLYAPLLEREPGGRVVAVEVPESAPPPPSSPP